MKTADEMFRKLGYYNNSECPCFNQWYTNPHKHTEIILNRGVFSKIPESKGFTTDEILACAQLIKEMKEE